MPDIRNTATRWYPVGGSGGKERAPVTAVLVVDSRDDYAVYVGLGDKGVAEDIACHGDKLVFDEALFYFPNLHRRRYRG